MWDYDKKLQYPVNINITNPKMAQFIISQYGGPDGELSASIRYLSQRFSFKNKRVAGLLTDIGTEELSHLEMVGAIVHQLTRNLTPDEIKKQGFDKYFVDHTLGVYPQVASGTPHTAAFIQVKGDPITDLFEDMAAEQKARTTYDNILTLVKDNEVADPIRFLRQREIVHFQRFGEALRGVQEKLAEKKYYINENNCQNLVYKKMLEKSFVLQDNKRNKRKALKWDLIVELWDYQMSGNQLYLTR